MISYSYRQCSSGIYPRLQLAIGVIGLAALTIVSFYLPAIASEVEGPRLADPRTEAIPQPKIFFFNDLAQSIDMVSDDVAQFQLPKHKKQMFRRQGLGDPPSPLIKHLKYEYSYGSESDFEARRNPDLNDAVTDDLVLLTPELNGFIRYRPVNWMELTLEMIFDREIDLVEEDVVILPDGDVQFAPDRRFSLLVDQLNVTFKEFTKAPLRVTVGRLNFEDPRHTLYDTSMDVVHGLLRYGKFNTELSFGRENLVDLEAIKQDKPDRINTILMYTEYKGIEDIKLAGYMFRRDDRDRQEGQPLTLGLRAMGRPTMNFSFWADFAYMMGEDEVSRDFSAVAFDVGGTYRFRGLPLNPNVTLGFALATGDEDPNDNKNQEFRQTGLQSNEAKFGGVSEFLIYGEALDPELSNIQIFTAGVGFRPIGDISIEFVYHRYWFDEIAEEVRNTQLTAITNQDAPGNLSKDIGDGIDVVVGLRSLFGVKRLGIDLRGGIFLPGKAFRNANSDGTFRKADKGVAVVGKFWW